MLARADYDAGRTAFLQALGYRVLRFWDNEALSNADGMVQSHCRSLELLRAPHPGPLPRGERGKVAPEGERVG